MDVKEAVRTAKIYAADIFADEQVQNVGLEGIEHDDFRGEWKVTLGFSRPWDRPGNLMALAISGVDVNTRRSYYVITISENDGKVTSVKPHRVPE